MQETISDADEDDGNGAMNDATRRHQKDVGLTIRLPLKLREDFVRACVADDTSASRVLRSAIKDYLKARKA